MEFSKFAKLLFPILGDGKSINAFVRGLFENIVDNDRREIVDAREDNTFNRYYSGKNGISQIARDINTHVDPMLFENYIYSFPEPTIQILADSFKPHISSIDQFNAPVKSIISMYEKSEIKMYN